MKEMKVTQSYIDNELILKGKVLHIQVVVEDDNGGKEEMNVAVVQMTETREIRVTMILPESWGLTVDADSMARVIADRMTD